MPLLSRIGMTRQIPMSWYNSKVTMKQPSLLPSIEELQVRHSLRTAREVNRKRDDNG